METLDDIKSRDDELGNALARQANFSDDTMSLIASSNYPDERVVNTRDAASRAGFEGSYYEGYPSKKLDGRSRYYQGAEIADEIEEMARQRAMQVFVNSKSERADYEANVQAPAGAILNLGVYLGIANPGDRILSPSLSGGYGHLSHGADSPSHIGRIFDVKGYGIEQSTGLIDYDQIRDLARQHKPKIIIGGASSYPRDIDWEIFVEIAEEVGAVVVADIAHPAGLIAAGELKNPADYGVEAMNFTTHKTLGGVKGAVTVYNARRIAEKVRAFGDDSKFDRRGNYNGIDFSVFPGLQGGPHLPTIAAHADLFKIAQEPEFRQKQKDTIANAQALAQLLQNRGWEIATEGTDNHIVLLSRVGNHPDTNNVLFKDGWDAAVALQEAGIVTNKNAVPGTEGTPFRPAGIRLGTQAITTRGLSRVDIEQIGQSIHEILSSAEDASVRNDVRRSVSEMCAQYPRPTRLEM